jgi:RNA polymerase sigma factor (sigma-70 family)
MDTSASDQRLSQIKTRWSVLLENPIEPVEGSDDARKRLLLDYYEAVYRYLLGAVRNPDTASDLAQEFALRFLRGAFRHADPERGRFRDYVKTALIHLVNDHHAARAAASRPLPGDTADPASLDPAIDESEPDFVANWRSELLARTWKALASVHPVYHAVLVYRLEEAEITSAEIAERLSVQLGKPMRADQVRKAIQRAHERFAALLLDEVARSLGPDSKVPLVDELRELDLLKYCQSSLVRRDRARRVPSP